MSRSYQIRNLYTGEPWKDADGEPLRFLTLGAARSYRDSEAAASHLDKDEGSIAYIRRIDEEA